MNVAPVAEVYGMVPCPGCGVLLEGRLVAAIKDPGRPESCPKGSKPKRATQPRSRFAEIAVWTPERYEAAIASLALRLGMRRTDEEEAA